ncbi:hypothetical protein K432DRAFT_310798, partial [Lepidopterella palustris CBS 459.81]
DNERYIFWLSGWAGTGKLAIARTIARKYYNKEYFIASFSFSRGGGDVSHAGKFAGTILQSWLRDAPRSSLFSSRRYRATKASAEGP